jgi:hypothetical protein
MAGYYPLDDYRDHLIDLGGKIQLRVNQLRAALGRGPASGTNVQSLKRDIERAGGRAERRVKEAWTPRSYDNSPDSSHDQPRPTPLS